MENDCGIVHAIVLREFSIQENHGADNGTAD